MEETNPVLGEQIIEVVRRQIKANNPPQMKQTYERLLKEGHAEDDVMKMLGCAAVAEIYYVMKEKKPFDEARYVAMLDALPTLPE